MDNLEIEINEELGIVLITDPSELLPDGEPLIVEYSIDEWETMQE